MEIIYKKYLEIIEPLLPRSLMISGIACVILAILLYGLCLLWEHFKSICPGWLWYLSIYFLIFTMVYCIFLTSFAILKDININRPGRIFKGKWINTFSCPPDAPPSDPPELFEIRKGYQYICWGEHRFDIVDLKINKKAKKMLFTKVYRTIENNHLRENDLTIEDVNKMDHFFGTETGDNNGRLTKVDYKKYKYTT